MNPQPPPSTDTPTWNAAVQEFISWDSGWRAVRRRIIAGVMLILPAVATIALLKMLYDWLTQNLINPVADWLVGLYESQNPPAWFENYAAPALAVVIILGALYLLGMFFHSRVHHVIERMLLRLPLVTTVYKAVRDVLESFGDSSDATRFKEVVLVEFPHPGMRVPAFVTAHCTDSETGETILCVYVPTTPVPTSGYMIMVPESQTTLLNWTLDETLKAVVSGGITVPSHVQYHRVGTGGHRDATPVPTPPPV